MTRKLIVEIVGDASSLQAALKKSAAAADTFEAKMQNLGKSTTRLGKTLSRDVTLPLVGIGVAGVKMAKDFDLTISRLQGLAGVSAKQAKEWRTQILALAPVVGKAPQELAEGIYQITSAGVKGKAAFQALTVSAKASAAGLGDTATVADAVTSAMNAYAKSGLTAKHAVDVLTAAVRDGKGEASQFAPVIGKVVAVASQLGVSFDQVGGALAQMTKLGVPADDAATQLSATFSGLLKTTPQAEKALNAMGLSAKGLREELREKGLLATLETLRDKTQGSSVAMAEAFPNVRALRGILQLVGDAAQGTSQVFADTKNSTESLSTAFGAASKTDAFKMQQALANLKVAAIKLGETLMPLAENLATKLNNLATAYENLSPRQKAVITKLGELAALAGPLLVVTGNLVRLAAAVKALGTASAIAGGEAQTGGLLASLRGLKALGPIAVGVTIGVIDKQTGNHISNWMMRDERNPVVWLYNRLTEISGGHLKKFTTSTPSAPGPTPGSAVSPVPPLARPGGGVQIPTHIKPTHQTAGLPGFPAVDIMAKPGTKILAPEDGQITRHSGHDPNLSPPQGQGGPWGWSLYFMGAKSGNSYYMTHLQWVAPLGSYKRGQVIGIIGDYPGSPADHVHLGIHAGSSVQATAPSTNTSGSGGGASTSTTSTSTYDPLAAAKKAAKKSWVGATQATITTLKGQIAADLKNLPATLDPLEQNAIKHIKALNAGLHVHMSAADLAEDRVELKKWGKVLKDEIDLNARVAAEAAAEAKKKFDRVLSFDVSKVLLRFDRQFAQVKRRFDKETAAGLAALDVTQTAEEKALADFLAEQQRTLAASQYNQLQTNLAKAISGGDAAEIAAAQDAISQAALDQQEQTLRDAAEVSRVAADRKTELAQQAYQEQRDDQWQALQDANDDQRTALQNNLDDWVGWLETKRKTWSEFLAWLKANGVDTAGLANPTTGTVGTVTLPGGLGPIPAGVIGHGFGGSFKDGGIVPGSLGQPMMILAHGGETVIPNGASGGGTTINVNVTGWVGNDQQIAHRIRDELVTLGRREPNIFGGFA